MAFVVGLIFVYWVIQTGSLWPAILGHALNNFFEVTFWYCELPDFWEIFNVGVIVLCGVILAVIGLWWFYQVAKREKTDQLEIEFKSEGTLGCD